MVQAMASCLMITLQETLKISTTWHEFETSWFIIAIVSHRGQRVKHHLWYKYSFPVIITFSYISFAPTRRFKTWHIFMYVCSAKHKNLHCDVTNLSLTTGVVALQRREGSECARNIVKHVKLCGQLMQVEWFVAIKIIYGESSITINISESAFVMYKSQV